MAARKNPFLLAADHPLQLMKLLQVDPKLAPSQDEHGYSLLHAAASYNHLDLLRALSKDFNVNINLKDEDGETALFVVETMDCARLLVEELHIDISIRNNEGQTAGEQAAEADEYPEVAVYLQVKESERSGIHSNSVTAESQHPGIQVLLPLPNGVSIGVGSMMPEDAGEVVDPEFRKKLEELAGRDDFQGEDGQRQLRALVEEAIRGHIGHEREVRRRVD